MPATAPISPRPGPARRSATVTPIAISTGIRANRPSMTSVRGRRSTQRTSAASSRPSGAAARAPSQQRRSRRPLRQPREQLLQPRPAAPGLVHRHARPHQQRDHLRCVARRRRPPRARRRRPGTRRRRPRAASTRPGRRPASRSRARSSRRRAARRSSPSAISEPDCSTATCVQVASTSVSRCDDTTTVAPPACSSAMMPRTSRVPAGSRPLVGSSRTTRRRGSSSAAARPSRCFMPERVAAVPAVRGLAEPDPVQRGVHGGRDRPRRAAAARWPRPGAGSPGRTGTGGTPGPRPAPRRAAAPAPRRRASDRPSSSTVPAVGRVRPSSIRISVVLPEPFGPSMPSTAPSGMSRSTSSTATVDPNTLRSPADPGGDSRGRRPRSTASVDGAITGRARR